MARKRYPGKFEGCADDRLAEVLYSISQDGCDEDCGDVNESGWYGLILHRNHGYIVSEDSQGFFSYDYYPMRGLAQAEFNNISSSPTEVHDEPEYPAADEVDQ